jgi:hypothetical protein
MVGEPHSAWHPDPYGGGSWRWWDGNQWTGHTSGAYRETPFAPMAEAVGQRLVLERSPEGSDGELSLGDRRVAGIRKPGFSAGGGDCREGSWEFARDGLANERFIIRSLPSRAEIARFRWGAGGMLSTEGLGGTLEFLDGRHFSMIKSIEARGEDSGLIGGIARLGSTDWTLLSAAGEPLVRTDFNMVSSFRGIRDVGAGVIDCEVFDAAGDAPELPLLVLVANFMAWAVAISEEGRGRLRVRQD